MKSFVRLTAGLSLVAALLGCGDVQKNPEAEATTTPAPIPVSSTTVVREPVVEPLFGTGTIAAHKTTDVGPRVAGPAFSSKVIPGGPWGHSRP